MCIDGSNVSCRGPAFKTGEIRYRVKRDYTYPQPLRRWHWQIVATYNTHVVMSWKRQCLKSSSRQAFTRTASKIQGSGRRPTSDRGWRTVVCRLESILNLQPLQSHAELSLTPNQIRAVDLVSSSSGTWTIGSRWQQPVHADVSIGSLTPFTSPRY